MPLDKVTQILSKTDVAIATLSMYEKGLGSVSTIKTTQYLAQGVPIFYGYREDGFPMDAPFILELPNNPKNVVDNVDKIEKFIKYCFKNFELRKQARDFALANPDVNVKEKERLEYIRSIL